MIFNVVIATPSTGMCKSMYAYSLANLVAYFSQVRIYPEDHSQSLEILMLEGSGISSNREKMVIDALAKKDMTHLLFIDEDMGFNKEALHQLARRRLPIVGCNYRMRVPPAEFTALNMERTKRIETHVNVSGLEECYYMGFGFCLIAREVLEATEAPRFPIFYKPEMQGYTTEDLPFFVQAREKGFKSYVDHDTSKIIWHNGSISYTWNEDYTELNKNLSQR